MTIGGSSILTEPKAVRTSHGARASPSNAFTVVLRRFPFFGETRAVLWTT